MEDKNKYNTLTDFLPEGKGIIYVDTCGLEWVCTIYHKRDTKHEKASLKKLKSFCRTFRKRGYVSTSEGVSNEIQKSKNYWIEKKKEFKKIRGYIRSGGYRKIRNRGPSRERYHYFTEWLKANNNLYDILREGIELYSPNHNFLNPKEVEKFVGSYRKLSKVNKGLVYTTLNSGSGNGILSANSSLLKVYRRGVNEFDLKGCFICDSMNAKTLPLS
ncbi:hypothetical protein KAJ38_02525 [Candidatus Pacearchaeota archaeon]|nr:hypothetical protein [Candidatus Pacearchaeota archaeon]